MNPLPVLAAGALAMVSAFFGVAMARIFWAGDLKHAQHLHQIWDRQESSMQSQIDALQRTIKFKDETILIQENTIRVIKGENK